VEPLALFNSNPLSDRTVTDWTEEPYDNFSVGGLEKLHIFHRRFPEAPRDYRLT